MLRTTVSTLNLCNRICNQTNLNISHCEWNIQSIRRWRYRRPLELGTSKSKLFRIPELKPKNSEELAEMKRLTDDYRTRVKSIRAYLYDAKQKRDEASLLKPQSMKDDADFERISKINDEWNQSIAKMREIRLKAERIAMQKEIKWQLEKQREYEEEQRRIIDELVLKEKEAAKSFIVRENFDEALDLALAEKSDFNFAIDLDGNVYRGREGEMNKSLEIESELESK